MLNGINLTVFLTLFFPYIYTHEKFYGSLLRAIKNELYLSVLIENTIFTSRTGDGTSTLRDHPSQVMV